MGHQRKRSAREMMQRLAKQYGCDRTRTCRAFAHAERAGQIVSERKSIEHTPEEYAVSLWDDGERRGWLREPR